MLRPLYQAVAEGLSWAPIDEGTAARLREENADLLVAGTLEAVDANAWPPADRATLARRRHHAIARELQETRLLSETLRRLHEARVSCLILKGAAIARTHYAVSWWRCRGDIDVLVPPDAFAQAERPFLEVGWRPAVEPSEPIVSGQRHFSHIAPGAPPLDVHLRLFAPVLEDPPSFAELWDRRRAIPGMAGDAWTLSDADALWYCCVHLALHHPGDAGPLWLFDLDRLARRLDDCGWEVVRARARATRTRTLCAGVLHLAVGLFGTPLPDEVRTWSAIRGESPDRFLAARSELKIQWLNLRALRGWRARARWIRAHVVPDASYMRERYAVRGGAGLPVAYTRRAVSGTLRWITDALAGRR